MIHNFKEQIDRRVEAYGNAGSLVSFLDYTIGQMISQRLSNIRLGEVVAKR
ncbi:MAG: hypothetical protein LBK44_03915 [Spirochaetales bacterium]|nr:hypothetical protein [Spirochaetales bacterium]